MANSPQFCIQNDIKYNSLLIIDKNNFNDGDLVIATVAGKHEIIKYENTTMDIEILGKIVYKISDYNL
jgi:hypothetical protein